MDFQGIFNDLTRPTKISILAPQHAAVEASPFVFYFIDLIMRTVAGLIGRRGSPSSFPRPISSRHAFPLSAIMPVNINGQTTGHVEQKSTSLL